MGRKGQGRRKGRRVGSWGMRSWLKGVRKGWRERCFRLGASWRVPWQGRWGEEGGWRDE